MTAPATQRTLAAPIAGPVVLDLDMPHGQIEVRVCDTDRAEIDLTTPAPADSPAGQAIADATLAAEMRALTVRVPTLDGGATIISHTRGGRVVVSGNVNSGIIVSGGNITITGGSIRGGQIISGATVNPGVRATVWLPNGSALRVRTKTAEVLTTGDLEWMDFASTSGDLLLEACRKLAVSSTSGDIRADIADHAEVRTVSGDIALGRTETATAASTSGDIRIGDFGGNARLTTVSGDITVHATEPGQITARASSGDIHISAPADLAAATGENGLIVDAHSRSGDVRTPRPLTSPAHPRRPRRR
ncbi:DUF4097 family beta strand repeat-containing protein [Nonomuraea sp. NPDC050022]|uniref:DUF4097 family beta strand repeat-containing protein n=1 Tax=Nonomuraea sp. NPDC050022 TaxID=3364358 RepID=UPI0037BAC2FA